MALLFRLFFLFLQFGLFFAVCPIGTIRGVDPSNCYKFHGTPADFDSAHIQCVLDGGNLASIFSAFINDFISRTVLISLSESTMTWIGGKRNETGWAWTDGKPFSYNNWAKDPACTTCWGWTDGTEVTYTNWLSYDPNITGSSCVDMISSGSSHYGSKNVWENGYWSCTSQLPSICKQAPICNSG
uniref:C-type lectin domain-containing protein n=1 Tax=Acrobeloides nanus TaxID=290746 RepID=A0A914CZE6_9BILA